MLFLGGTINNNWREQLIPFLEEKGVKYYNPVVSADEYNDAHKDKEREMLLECDEHLFVITSEQKGYRTFCEINICEFLARTKIVNHNYGYLRVVLIKENFNEKDYYEILDLLSSIYLGTIELENFCPKKIMEYIKI